MSRRGVNQYPIRTVAKDPEDLAAARHARILFKRKLRRLKNRDALNAKARAHRLANKDKIREQQRRWEQRRRYHVRAQARRHYHLRKEMAA